MINRLFSISLLLTLSLSLNAGAYTTIKGNIGNASGYQIRLLTWSDQLTFVEKKLAAADIDSKGNFNLITELQATTHAFFAIGNIRADIILEPGNVYEIQFDDYPPVSYLETRNLILQKESIGYKILNRTDEDINIVVADALTMYNKFISKHYMDLYLKRYDVVNEFIDTFFLKFGEYTHPWVRQMVDYRIAMLKLSGYKISIEQAHELWLKGVDFEYQHPDFMDFFNQLFSNYLTTRLKHYTYQDLKSIINNQGTYHTLSELMGRDTLLRNELLREIVMIKSLGEMVHNKDFDENNVLRILQHIAYTSKFREHRIIASNLVYLNTRFNRGMIAPDFKLPDKSGNYITPGQYRGKYLYIVFFASNCIPCLSELQLLRSVYPDISDNIAVIAIGLDPDTVKLWRFTDQQKFPWPVVHFSNDFELTDRYNIRNYPLFILIAPDGSFESYGARQPSEQFKTWFEEAVLRKK